MTGRHTSLGAHYDMFSKLSQCSERMGWGGNDRWVSCHVMIGLNEEMDGWVVRTGQGEMNENGME